MNPTTSPLAIVGIGCLFPKSASPGFFWANIKHGTDCIDEVPATHWKPEEYFDKDPKKPDMTYARRGGFLSAVDFNPLEFGIAPRDIEATDTTQLLGLVAAKQALVDAGVVFSSDKPTNSSRKPVDRSRVSVILGVTGTLELVIPLGARLGHPKWRKALKDAGVAEDVAQDVIERISEQYVPWQENSFPGLLGNVVAGRIANKLDLHGTNCVVDAACASSLSAVHLAALELQTGKADVVVTGGADTFNDIFMFMCFSKTPALSPSGNSRPFDAAGDGTILGEGLGMVVIKRLADAERDGDKIYAVLKGIGTSSDGKGNAIYAPSADGQRRCLLDAYSRANVTPDTIELIEAHGTGTKVGDATEATALTEVFTKHLDPSHQKERPWCAIGSVKSQIGHTKAAAGSASLIKTVLSLYNKVLPPTIKVNEPVGPLQASDSPFYVNTQMRPWLPRAEHPRRAGLSAFGFGGSNFHAVLEEHETRKREPDWDGRVEILALGASAPAVLAAALERMPTTWEAFAAAAHASRQNFDLQAECRLILAVGRDSDLAKVITNTKNRLLKEPDAREWHSLDGASFGRGAVRGKLAVVFPGQGSQYVGMLRELSCLFPEMLDVLSSNNETWRETSEGRLTDRIYPARQIGVPRSQQEDALRATNVAQPALGAVSFGAWKCLHERFHLQADAFAGHSYGELPALTAAGYLAERDMQKLSLLRGDLMAQQGEKNAGTMLAVIADRKEIEGWLRENPSSLVLANHNSPRQSVLSGSRAEIEKFQEVLKGKGIRSTLLPVAAAFHSPQVAEAARPFRSALESVPFTPTQTPVFANTTGQPYSHDSQAIRDLLGEQLAKPVAFVDQIQEMIRSGIRTFVEVGPGAVLTRLIEQISESMGDSPTPSSEIMAIAVDGSSGKRSNMLDLAIALARLIARGHGLDLKAWEAASACRPTEVTTKPGLTVPVCGANSMLPRPVRPAVLRTIPHVESLVMTEPNSVPKVPANDLLTQALASTQQTLAALQRMQEQTAHLHKQFLDSQEQAQKTLAALVSQQSSLIGSVASGSRDFAMPRPVSVPVPPPPSPKPAAAPASVTHVYTAQEVANLAATLPLTDRPSKVAPVPAPRIETPAPAPARPVVPQASPVSTGANGTHSPPLSGIKKISDGVADEISKVLLAVVSEKTGYPVEMLALDMSLDGDLGIDSIKRVEILSTLQERLPEAPVAKPEHLGSLHTLRDVALFLSAGPVGAAAPMASFAPAVTAASAAAATAAVSELLFPAKSSEPASLAVPSLHSTPVVPTITTREPYLAAVPAHDTSFVDVDIPLATPVDIDSGGMLEPPSVLRLVTPNADIPAVLLGVVSEKTGYPVEMLSLEMALDADLGIDSIKRVEILSSLQEKLPHAPIAKPEHLGSLHTLQDVANFLTGKSGDSGPATTKIPMNKAEVITEEMASQDSGQLSGLQLPMPMFKDLTDSGTKTEHASKIFAQTPNTSILGEKDTHKHVPKIVEAPESIERSIVSVIDLDVTAIRPRVKMPERAEIWIIAEDEPLTRELQKQFEAVRCVPRIQSWNSLESARPSGTIAGLIFLPPANAGDMHINRLAVLWLQLIGPRMRSVSKPSEALLSSVVRIDGAFGLANLNSGIDPALGGLAGLIKTVSHEWPEIRCKAIDVTPSFAVEKPVDSAAIIYEELMYAGPIEVGIAATHRCSLELARTVRRSATSGPAVSIRPEDVILVTGGARGVTAEAAVAFAEAFQPTLILTGRTPAPSGPEPAWLIDLVEESDIKRALAEQLGAAATPKTLNDQYSRIIAQREIRQTLERVHAAGAKAQYYPVNVANGRALADLLHQVKVRCGKITGLIHGAGVLADRRIEALTPEQFDYVYTTKVDGGRMLLDLLSGEDLQTVILFASTTGRFGRTGQLAYAIANEVLNKMAQIEARRRPTARVVSINWGPWEGGMVTPGLRKVFESEGVGLIPLPDGGKFVVSELTASGRAVEVVALGRGTERPTGFQQAGPAKANIPAATAINAPLPVAPTQPGTNPPPPEVSIAFERVVDVASHPVLRSHVLDGRAVLPMAIHMEWLAHAALHGNPGLVFHGFNDLRITHGVMVEDGSSTTLRLMAGKATKSDKNFSVPVEIRGRRRDGREVIHSRAEVILTTALPKAPNADRVPDVQPYPHPIDEVYRYFIFHGPDLHGVESVEGFSDNAFIGTAYPAPAPAEWFTQPLRSAWVCDPLAVDAAFQMMILWSFAQHGAGSLPCFLGRYRQFRRSFPSGPTRIVIRVTRDNGSFARADMDFLDSDGMVVAQVQDYECVIDAGLNQAFRRNQLGPLVRQ